MLSRHALILSTGTVGNPSLPDLIAAAEAGDYASIALWPMDYERWRAEGVSDAEAKRRLDEAGIAVAQLDCLLMWSLAGSRRAAAEEDAVFGAGDVFAPPMVSVIGPADDRFSADQLAEALAGVRDRARERGFRIALEVSPWKGTIDVPAACDLLQRTHRDDIGLVIDSWHMFRGATGAEVLSTVPSAAVTAVQISDAPAAAADDLVAETMTGRLLPGEGAIDLGAFLRALDRPDGPEVALTVEVLSDAVRAHGPVTAARRTAQATRSVLADALTSGSSAG